MYENIKEKLDGPKNEEKSEAKKEESELRVSFVVIHKQPVDLIIEYFKDKLTDGEEEECGGNEE